MIKTKHELGDRLGTKVKGFYTLTDSRMPPCLKKTCTTTWKWSMAWMLLGLLKSLSSSTLSTPSSSIAVWLGLSLAMINVPVGAAPADVPEPLPSSSHSIDFQPAPESAIASVAQRKSESETLTTQPVATSSQTTDLTRVPTVSVAQSLHVGLQPSSSELAPAAPETASETSALQTFAPLLSASLSVPSAIFPSQRAIATVSSPAASPSSEMLNGSGSVAPVAVAPVAVAPIAVAPSQTLSTAFTFNAQIPPAYAVAQAVPYAQPIPLVSAAAPGQPALQNSIPSGAVPVFNSATGTYIMMMPVPGSIPASGNSSSTFTFQAPAQSSSPIGGTSSPIIANVGSNPYALPGFNPSGSPVFNPVLMQNPYASAPYTQAPYGQAPYTQAPYGQAPYGQAPYGQSPTGYGQSPVTYGQVTYGQNPNPYAPAPSGQQVPIAYSQPAYGSQNLYTPAPYGQASHPQAPYGQAPVGYGQPAYVQSPNPYAPAPYPQAPYIQQVPIAYGQPAYGYQNPYAPAPYGQASYPQAPYGQAPVGYGQPAYGQSPYGQAPTAYTQNPYGQAPYGQAPYGQAPYGQAPSGYQTTPPLTVPSVPAGNRATPLPPPPTQGLASPGFPVGYPTTSPTVVQATPVLAPIQFQQSQQPTYLPPGTANQLTPTAPPYTYPSGSVAAPVPLGTPGQESLARRAPITSPSIQLQGGFIYQGDDFSGRARVSAIYPFSPNVLLGGILDFASGPAITSTDDEGVNLNELYLAASLDDLPNLRLLVGQLDLTSYFDRNSFAKDSLTHFLNPVFQTNPALASAAIGSRPGILLNWSLSDNLEVKAAAFSSDRSITDFALDGFAGEVGFRTGNFILRGTYTSSIDGGQRSGFQEIFSVARQNGGFGVDENDREDAYGVNAELFIPELNMGIFGRYGQYANQDLDLKGDTYSLGVNFLDLFTPGDRLGLGYGRTLSNDRLRVQAGTELPDVLEVFYDLQLNRNLRMGFSFQQLNEFSESVAGIRVRADFDVSPRGSL